MMRGVSLVSFIGPGVSARYSDMPPTPSMGRMATASTTMPMPDEGELLAVIKYRLRQLIETGDDGGAGGGETGHRLEHRLGERQMGLEHEGNGADHAEHRPEHHHDDEAVAGAQLAPLSAHRQPHGGAHQKPQAEREQEFRPFTLAVGQGHQQRRQQSDTVHHEQNAEDALNDGELHGSATRSARCTPAANRSRVESAGHAVTSPRYDQMNVTPTWNRRSTSPIRRLSTRNRIT